MMMTIGSGQDEPSKSGVRVFLCHAVLIRYFVLVSLVLLILYAWYTICVFVVAVYVTALGTKSHGGFFWGEPADRGSTERAFGCSASERSIDRLRRWRVTV